MPDPFPAPAPSVQAAAVAQDALKNLYKVPTGLESVRLAVPLRVVTVQCFESPSPPFSPLFPFYMGLAFITTAAVSYPRGSGWPSTIYKPFPYFSTFFSSKDRSAFPSFRKLELSIYWGKASIQNWICCFCKIRGNSTNVCRKLTIKIIFSKYDLTTHVSFHILSIIMKNFIHFLQETITA